MQLAQQFEQVLCSQPFSLLGVVKNQQKSVLRVWRPNVSKITIEWENAALANVTVTSKNGLFETPLPKEYQGEVYRVIAEGLNDDKGYIDPYQFSEQAYHAVHYIDSKPSNLYEQAGAQLLTLTSSQGDAIKGVRFCVFAPNASTVSLIGDFNQWDGRTHPMEKTSMGYWVLFVPSITLKMHTATTYRTRLTHLASVQSSILLMLRKFTTTITMSGMIVHGWKSERGINTTAQ